MRHVHGTQKFWVFHGLPRRKRVQGTCSLICVKGIIKADGDRHADQKVRVRVRVNRRRGWGPSLSLNQPIVPLSMWIPEERIVFVEPAFGFGRPITGWFTKYPTAH